MFFSNQLLCRKGPLGQIWVVATMHAKLSRKKAEQINIGEICMHVLQPQVPLALRLSGILMGGIVLIYDRKVKLLQDDVNEFLAKLKTAVDHKDRDKAICLPRSKLQAKFENVTINYDFDEFDDIERAMHAPTLSGQEEFNLDQQENPASGGADPYEGLGISGESSSSKRASSGRAGASSNDPTMLHQVSNEDITLEERNLSGSFHVHERYEDIGMDFQEDRIPPSDNLFMEDFFPEIRAEVIISPEPVQKEPFPEMDIQMEEPPEQQTHPDQSELEKTLSLQEDGNLPDPQPESQPIIPPEEGDQALEPEPYQGAPAPANLRRKRVGNGAARRVIIDEEHVEIPAQVFALWIRDPSDIRERQLNSKPPIGKDPVAARAQRRLDLPSVGFLSPTSVYGVESFWAPQLSGLWERTITGKLPPPPQEVTDFRAPWPTGQRVRREQLPKPSTPLQLSPRNSDPSSHTFGDASGGNSSPVMNGSNDEPAGDVNPDITLADHDHPPAEDIQEPNEFRDYGSVEKLRAALSTPSAASDDLLGNVFRGTPGPQQRYTRSDRSRSGNSGSGCSNKTLLLDPETDLPSDGSGRFKKPRRLGSFRSSSPVTSDNVSPGVDGAGSSYNFFSSQAASLNRLGIE
ncbi:hypothetical protein R1flu_015633 [Riccia fluitans]|uniref:Rad21/Rec8-like protein N-terminal domain-containing protein n=1 Tax=Riccia fluitans TaxID=41844 RepID=A0ABD1YJL1_9MARC